MTFFVLAPRVASRLRTPIAALLLQAAAATSLHAQVGHLPDKSPYEDIKPTQSLSASFGWLSVKRDPANVAPAASPFFGVRYDLPVGGPASMFARYAFAPSERNVLDPSKPRATRLVGTPSSTTHLADIGLDVALTGKKTWRHLIPSVNGAVGLVSDFASADTGAYRFGTKFSFAYGATLRYMTRSGWTVRADVSNHIWQYEYPDRYFVLTSDTTSILTDTRSRSAWRGNWAFSAGISMPLFR